MEPVVTNDVAGGVATITLNRPDTRNALSAEVVEGLAGALRGALNDDGVRVVVLTNAGTTFCAGADLKQAGDGPSYRDLVGVLETILDAPKPVVGRIAGHCLGGGNGLAAACDISIAATDVRFGFSEVRLGVAPAVISVVCLAKMRRADALELFLTGEPVPAARAAEVGLINRAVRRADLDAAVAETTRSLLAGGPNALAACKELTRRLPDMQRSGAFEWTAKLSAALFGSDEAAAGIAAFKARTSPPWVPAAEEEPVESGSSR